MTSCAPRGTVIVAVGFDEQTDDQMVSAIYLANRLQLELRLIHAVSSYPAVNSLDYSAALFAYTGAFELEQEEREAHAKMEHLLAGIPANIKATGAVVVGQPIALITAEAVVRRASLIITACDPESYTRMNAGFSTTIGLMDQASVPVLVTSRHSVVDFSAPEFRLLLADDLQESTREAAAKTYELACRLGCGTKVRHVYVHGDFRELIHRSWAISRTTAPWSHSPELTPEAAIAKEEAIIHNKMQVRGDLWRNKAEVAGVQVACESRTGRVQTELHEVAESFKPDLIVYGRHRALRARPFLVGRMAFRTMLADKRAVLMVPPTQELYSLAPFPGA